MNFIKSLLARMKNHHIDSFSSQIAFFMLLSIFPFLILLFMMLTELSLSFGDEMNYIYSIIPNEASNVIQDYLAYSMQFSNKALSPLLIVSIWMSSNGMVALMKATNIAYNLEETRNYFKRKLIAILCTLLTLLLVVSALFIPNIGSAIITFIRRYLNIPEVNIYILNTIRLLISGVVFFSVLGAMYYILPNKKMTFKEVLPGTIFSFLGLVFISYLFAFFVTTYSQYSLVYGSLAAVIVLLIWLFLCGITLMLGSEVNAMLYEKHLKNSEN